MSCVRHESRRAGQHTVDKLDNDEHGIDRHGHREGSPDVVGVACEQLVGMAVTVGARQMVVMSMPMQFVLVLVLLCWQGVIHVLD